MDIVYRTLEKEDIPKVVAMFHELAQESAEVSFAEILSEEEIAGWLDNENKFVYGAFEGERLLGILGATRGEGNENHCVELTAAVGRNDRGKNIGKAMINYAVEQLKLAGVKLARAYIYSDNRPSINTILSCDFTFSGCVYQHHYCEKQGKYVDDLIFHKIL